MADTAKRSADIAESIAGMEAVNERVEDIAASILALAEQAQAVGEIIATVNDIAEQTNCWRSTPASRQPGPANRGRASRWWRRRSRNWPARPRRPPSRSAGSWATSSRPPTRGLRAVHAAGGRIIAQNEESSVVFGMNGVTVAAGLADVTVAADTWRRASKVVTG